MTSNKLDNRNNIDTNEPQFIKLKGEFIEKLEKSYINYNNNIIKNTNNNREKIEKVQKCIKNDNNYPIIMEALLYGILYDSSNSELYFQCLLEINKDNFDCFLGKLKDLIDKSHMELSHSNFIQI